MPTRTVTGTVYNPDGSPMAGGEVSFTLQAAFTTATETYPCTTHTEILDASGQFSITLGVPDTGTAQYKITIPGHQEAIINIASGAPTTLETLLTIAVSAVAQSALQTLLDQASVLTIVTKAAPYTVLDTDEIVRCNGTFAVTLPAATGSGRAVCVKNVGAGTVTLTAAGADTIDGSATQAIYTLCWMVVLDAAAGVWDVI